MRQIERKHHLWNGVREDVESAYEDDTEINEAKASNSDEKDDETDADTDDKDDCKNLEYVDAYDADNPVDE